MWVHDYHLMLLPNLLRERLPTACIGFFLHVPFPSSEIYRVLPKRLDLLRGVLGADLIGFHTWDYARHFMHACNRLLGLQATANKIHLNGRLITVNVFPVGIDIQEFETQLLQPETQRILSEMESGLKGYKVLLGVDRYPSLR